MSNYPPPGMPPTAYPPPAYPPPPQPSGCGCGGCMGKFFILLGVLFFLMLVVCCGGFFYLGSLVQHGMTQQPNEVREICDEVTSIDVPDPPLAPVGGARIKMPFTGNLIGEGAAFADKGRTAFLFVGTFGSMFGVDFKDQLLQAVENGQFQNKPANAKENERAEELKDVKKSQVDRTIRGEKAVFQITEGVGVKSGKKKIRVQGAFQGKLGPSLLIIDADEETLSREKVDDVINSIDGGGQAEKK